MNPSRFARGPSGPDQLDLFPKAVPRVWFVEKGHQFTRAANACNRDVGFSGPFHG